MLGCDDGWLFLWDDQRGAFRLHPHGGLRPEILARALRPGRLYEVADASRQAVVPLDMMQLFDCASLRAVPLSRHGEVVGLLVFSHRTRRGAFSPKEHRLAFGIAQAATVALENGRLIASLQATMRRCEDGEARE